jgi:foldase protein PrsA
MTTSDTHRRRTPRTALAAICALALPMLALTACGNDVPKGAVAKVGDTQIKKAEFDHWMRIAALSSQGPTQGTKAPAVNIPQPPDFKDCVAQKQKTTPAPPKGQPKPTTQQFKDQCKQEYEGLRDQVMQLLIQNEWVEGEAKERGVKVTDAEVRKAFDQQKKQSFPKEKDYQQFLKTSGFTEQDVLFRVRLETLSTKLREAVIKGKDKVSDAQISDYYNKNKAKFAQPERRDLRIVLTKTASKANEAKKALQGGATWKSVTKRYSVDQTTKAQGGKLLAVAKGQQEPSLDKAVFAAKKGVLTGPIKTQFGFYVFEVQKITPKSQQSLEQAKATIRGIVTSDNSQKALETFLKDFKKQWKDETVCAKNYVTQDCSNAPKPKKTDTSTVPPGAVPQGGGQPGQTPQQAPPGSQPVPQQPQTPGQ